MTRTLWMLAPALLLAACGQQPAPEATFSEDVPWSYVAPADKLSALALDPGPNTLSFEPLLSATNGYGPVELNKSNGEAAAGDGKPLTLNGVVYQKGFGVHSNSDLVYSLQNTKGAVCSVFTASIGVDDEVAAKGSVRFQVLTGATPATATQIYDSGVMTGATATKTLNLNVAGSKVLILRVTDGGDGKNFDHADWGTPNVTCTAAATPAAGTVDTGFATAGFGTFARTALAADGKILGFGHVSVPAGTPRNYFVRRLDQDGNPDGGFASPLLPFSAEGDEHTVVVQPDGKVLIMGQASAASSPAPGVGKDNFLFIRRLLPSGQPDGSFGTGSGTYAGVQFLNGGFDSTQLVIQPDGRLVLGGSQGGAFFLRRLLSSGQPDSSFGTAGQVTSTFGGVNALLESLTVQPDGKLLAGGGDYLGAANRYRAVIARYTASGALDPSLGGAGSTEILRDTMQASTQAIQALPDGKMLVASRVFGDFGLYCNLKRLNPNGTPDASFLAFAPGNLKPNFSGLSLAVQPGGRVILGGARFGDAGDGSQALFRFNGSGSLDTSFGNVTDQLGNTGAAVSDSSAVLMQPANVGGKLISGSVALNRVWP